MEDEHDLAKLLRDVLEDEGYEVAVDSTGDCFALVRSFRPDVILCDFALPAFSGQAVLQRLRTERLARTPVVLMSAMGHAARNWREWGAANFLAKPFDIDRLLHVVDIARTPNVAPCG